MLRRLHLPTATPRPPPSRRLHLRANQRLLDRGDAGPSAGAVPSRDQHVDDVAVPRGDVDAGLSDVFQLPAVESGLHLRHAVSVWVEGVGGRGAEGWVEM